MWWRRRKPADPIVEESATTLRAEPVANESPDTLRAELVTAAESLRHQIDVQNAVRFSRGGGNGGDDLAVAMLQTQLDQVVEALDQLDRADIKPDDQGPN